MLRSPVSSGFAVGSTDAPASTEAAGVGGGGAVTAGPSDAVPPRGPHAPRTSPSTAAPATARSHVLLRMWVISSPAPLVPRRFRSVPPPDLGDGPFITGIRAPAPPVDVPRIA